MPDAVNNIINDYLGNVRRRLRRLPEDERVAIVDSLESHIHEALASRCRNAEPTPDDVKAVLAEMDPPEAFGLDGDGDDRVLRPGPRLGKAALIVCVTVVTAFLLSANLGPPKQLEEWNLTQFKTEIIKGRVNNGELSSDRFVGETKKGVSFFVSLPKANDGQQYWINLLTRHRVVVRVNGQGWTDMIGTMVVSFALPMVIWLGTLVLVILVVRAIWRLGGPR
jgi:hypothetical protein